MTTNVGCIKKPSTLKTDSIQKRKGNKCYQGLETF